MIPITRLALGDAEIDAASEVLRSGWLMNGPRTEQFEQLVADYVGASHAVAVSSCTAALHLALLAAGVGPGDEVICPSFSFIATANAIRLTGARPVFVDIDAYTFNIDPYAVQTAVTSRTTAVMPVSQIGLPADIPAVLDVASTYGLRVVEDAAPSLGSAIGGKRVGSLSDLTCFSFDARKILTTGEGGMITTDEAGYASRLRALRAHAASVSTADRDRSRDLVFETYPEVGFNYKITDIQSAIGIVQMSRIEEVIAERRRLAARYDERLADIDRVTPPYEPLGYQHVYQSYCVRIDGGRRDDVMAAMNARGVATRRILAIHEQPPYRDEDHMPLPVTEDVAANTMLLPMFVGLTDAELDETVDALVAAL
jgi:dTDP-4-amino-4,6-dideoxygalactose transaminase